MSDRPSFDPWLSHLRRDRRGLPVPYINLWGPDDESAMKLRHCRYTGMRSVFIDDEGETVPDFTKQNHGRQRECMSEGLCQVCARPVPWSRRFLVLAPMTVELVRIDNEGPFAKRRPAVFEPWLDERCVELATKWCPALIRRRRDEQLTVVPVRSQRDVQLVVSTGCIRGPREAETRRNQVGMMIKAVFRDPQVAQEILAIREAEATANA